MLVLLVLLPAAASPALAQQEEPPREPDGERPAAADTTARKPPATPLAALGRSVILPGWGQAKMDKPGRGAFYFLGEAASAFMVVRSQLRLASARRGAAPDADLVQSRKQQRENWIVISVFWSLLSGVDAWVTAHFWGYEGKVEPPEDGSVGVELRYEIPVGGG